MPQSLAQIYVHLVFSTKHRYPFLGDAALRADLHRYLGGICRHRNSPSLIVGGIADHVHVLLRLSPLESVAVLVRELKRESSKWLKTKKADLIGFSWQAGDGAFSISPGHVEALEGYIGNQEDHHKRITFQDEFRALLYKYGIEYDERYVWD
jgi:REP element-mobilizing transposase RayT